MRMLWYYFRELFKFNFLFSLVLGLAGIAITSGAMFSWFLKFFLFTYFTGGFLLAVFFYNLRFSHQYYSYYNKGFSKITLNILAYVLNMPLLTLLLLI